MICSGSDGQIGHILLSKHMVLLCIDDDPDEIDVFRDAVMQVDRTATSVTASNGQQAFELLEDGLRPDFIFLDINMPVLAGMETLRAMREDGRYRTIPVIMYFDQ